MFPLRLFTIVLLLNACSGKTPAPQQQHSTKQPASIPVLNYDSCKNAIAVIKSNLKALPFEQRQHSKEKYFIDAVTKTIIPAWIGTAWSFNGTTEIPGQGSIACGYFVTTVLRDAGLPLARIKLAQCASEEMIRVLVQSKYIQRFSNFPIEDFIAAVHLSGNGLYIVGLDNHTGFIYKNDDGILFIHSTFVGTGNVQQENAVNSSVLAGSRYKVIGKISADENALSRWMNH